MSESREQLAIIRDVRYGIGDRGKACLTFTTYTEESSAALQVLYQPQADQVIEQADVSDVHSLERRACWVQVGDGLMRFLRMADL